MVAALLPLVIVVAGCDSGIPGASADPELGSVAVQVERVADEDGFFASEHYARIARPDGTVIKEWRLDPNTITTVDVPVGSYSLSAFTVFLSDFMQCTADPAAAGGERCFQPTLGPAMVCSAPITVSPNARTEAAFSILADGACRLGLGVAPPASG